jgi:carbamoyltransferase
MGTCRETVSADVRKPRVYILGINAYHADAAACLVRDGALIAAAEEERFRRTKHWAGFPSEAIRYCLNEARVSLDQVDHVAVNQDSKANLWRKIEFTLVARPDLLLVIDRIRNRKSRASIPEQLQKVAPGQRFHGEVHDVEHHLAHLGSAFLISPFEHAAVVSVDGFGDFASAAWGVGTGTEITIDDKVYFPHSLGMFYEALTQYLGFPHYGDEYKVMGLAPYGQPNYLGAMRDIVLLQDDGSFRLNLAYFRHHHEKIEYEWDNGAPRVDHLFSPALLELLGPARFEGEALTARHKDIARSIQAMYEEAFFHLLNSVHEHHGVGALALAGGCAMNSVANGKVYQRTPFERLYVQAAAGDAGGAIGAAFVTWHELNRGAGREMVMDHAAWGPEFTPAEISAALHMRRDELSEQRCVVNDIDDEAELCRMTAKALTCGKVVGWFQGRMEWGPRALGNRSILCDPRRADMKELLNLKIKRRESFRPFAPSVLREAVPAWFEVDDDVPFMMQVYPVRKERRSQIPAVTHVDGSGRLQTVTRESNPLYYRLIAAFAELTGVPMVLNTSFNENEPVVCRPEEALDCFLRTKMDVLVLGTWFVSR